VGVPIKGFRQNGGGSALPAIERINAFAGFDFSKFAEEREPFSFGKSSDGSTLSFNAETRTALARGGYSVVGQRLLQCDKSQSACTNCIPPFAVCT
jgi:hypothetical protein